MFAWNPSRTVTGAAAVPALDVAPPDVEVELPEPPDEQPAISSALPTTAAVPAKILRI